MLTLEKQSDKPDLYALVQGLASYIWDAPSTSSYPDELLVQ